MEILSLCVQAEFLGRKLEMKYAIKEFAMGKTTYYVIFDNVNDTSSHLFKSKEEAKKALEKNYGKPAYQI